VLANYTDQTEGTLESLEAVEDAVAAIEAAADGLSGHRRGYLGALTRAFRTLVSILRDEGRPYGELVQGILEIDHQPIPASEARRLRAELHELLGRIGYEGPLEKQVPAWLEATSLTGDAVIDFGQSILDRARTDTERLRAEAAAGRGRRLVHRHPQRALLGPLAVHGRLPRLAALQRRQVLAAGPVRARAVPRGLPRPPDLLRAVGRALPAGALADRGGVLPAQRAHERGLRGRPRDGDALPRLGRGRRPTRRCGCARRSPTWTSAASP
jgi:hypothetical protein